MHGARGGAPEGKRNGNYRHGQATNEGRRIIARLNYLGRMLRRMRREEKGVHRLRKKATTVNVQTSAKAPYK
jgi:hypothetical protein